MTKIRRIGEETKNLGWFLWGFWEGFEKLEWRVLGWWSRSVVGGISDKNWFWSTSQWIPVTDPMRGRTTGYAGARLVNWTHFGEVLGAGARVPYAAAQMVTFFNFSCCQKLVQPFGWSFQNIILAITKTSSKLHPDRITGSMFSELFFVDSYPKSLNFWVFSTFSWFVPASMLDVWCKN